ncbi:MAG: hypothetical protein IJ546_04360 [Prevotella sp.]|nr:hypothetical protein [Prevotella sp.]
MKDTKWTENVIIADADYVDSVAFDLTVNFERMIGRQIPKADMPRWVECVALDGGLREGEHETAVVLIHHTRQQQMNNFMPGIYATELNGQAFKSHLGEFVFYAVTTEGMVSEDDLLLDTVRLAGSQPEVQRLMVIASDTLCREVRQALKDVDPEQKHVTLFTMQPTSCAPFRQELLGYSLMAALGIRSDEITMEN